MQRDLTEEQKKDVAKQAKAFEDQYAADSANLAALEGAGVDYAKVGDFKHAQPLLEKLTAAQPNDAEAWRLLVCTTVYTPSFAHLTSCKLLWQVASSCGTLCHALMHCKSLFLCTATCFLIA